MSNDISKRIREEIAASDANPDAPISDKANVSRPNQSRSKVYSVRLNPAEVASLQTLADQTGLPPSTLVRSWIIDRLRSTEAQTNKSRSSLTSIATGAVDFHAIQGRRRSLRRVA
jgi:hypothetical protein